MVSRSNARDTKVSFIYDHSLGTGESSSVLWKGPWRKWYPLWTKRGEQVLSWPAHSQPHPGWKLPSVKWVARIVLIVVCTVLTLFQELDKCFMYIVSTVLCRGDRASESPGSQSQWMFSDSNTFFCCYTRASFRDVSQRRWLSLISHRTTLPKMILENHLRTTGNII